MIDPVAILDFLFARTAPEQWFYLREDLRGKNMPIVPAALVWELPRAAQLDRPTPEHQYFFRVIPVREPEADKAPWSVGDAVCIWADLDLPKTEGAPPLPQPASIYPAPSVVCSSGNGLHLYWRLDAAIPANRAVQVAKLAALALNGDLAVCEKARIMRLPGSFNLKDPKQPRPCVGVLATWQTYSLDELIDHLLAVYLAPLFTDGLRHQGALGLGALLAYADYSVERGRALGHLLAELAGDDRSDIAGTIASSIGRHEADEAVALAPLKEIVADEKAWRILKDALGLSRDDGQLVIDGRVLDAPDTVHALVKECLDRGDWASADGGIAHWSGDYWQTSRGGEQLLADIWELSAQVKVKKDAASADLSRRYEYSSMAAKLVNGTLQRQPLDPMPDYFLPLKNAVLDLNTLDPFAHDRQIGNRYRLDYPYLADADCPQWRAFLASACPDLADYLQEWAGYLLLGGNPFQRMLWLYGVPGTGKSTFIKGISAILGPAARPVDAARLTPYDLAQLAHIRLATCTEIPPRTFQTTLLKALVSEDEVSARHPYGRPFPLVFRGKFVIATNTLPPLDDGDGMFRRLAIVKFDHKPAAAETVEYDKPIEAERSGILNWALEGLVRVQRYRESLDWPEPAAVTEMRAEYEDMSDRFGMFVEVHMELGDGLRCHPLEVLRAYNAWAKDYETRTMEPGPAFKAALKKAGLKAMESPRRVDGKSVRQWQGGRLKDAEYALAGVTKD